MLSRLSLSFLLTAFASSALARDFHVTPDGTGDGSEGSPMALGSAMDLAADGDTVWLHDGEYGDVILEGDHATATTVAAAAASTPRLRTLTLRNASHLVVRGLSISLSHAAVYERDTMVSIEGSAPDVEVHDCDIFSVPDEDTAGWDESDWVSLPGTGIGVRAERVTLSGNRVRNVGYGISIAHDAPNARVIGNLVANFSRDGLRGIGDFGLFEGNTVKNAYDVDDHHDDFFQSWSVGEDGSPGTGVIRGVVLRGNTFIGNEDRDQPFAGAAQGIGCFDGFFEDWVIENNVVIVNHWHGITLLGARNVRIVNNTVLDLRGGERPGPPWIQVSAHKDGTPSENIVIRNNLVRTITLEAESSVEDHNTRFEDATALFVDPTNHDLHLRADASDAIDTGSDESAPATDRDGVPRPQGAAVDQGAYEWHDGSVMPIDAGPRDAGLADSGSADGGSVDGGSIDSGVVDGVDGGITGPGEDGCGCAATGPSGGAWLAVLFLWATRLRRRRPH